MTGGPSPARSSSGQNRASPASECWGRRGDEGGKGGVGSLGGGDLGVLSVSKWGLSSVSKDVRSTRAACISVCRRAERGAHGRGGVRLRACRALRVGLQTLLSWRAGCRV